MASEGRGSDRAVADVLFDEAYSFEFFQAVRLLERIHPGRSLVGRSSEPAREVARFRTRASLSFPASEVHAITRDGDGERPPQMMVTFMGLTGPSGLLPSPYTELLIERLRYKDTALWEFLDIFNHRMISHFYRAWEKYRLPVGYERGEDDRFRDYLFCLIGMGTRGLRGRLSLPDDGLLYYGGLLAQRPHSASAIEAALSDYLNAPVRANQFAGQWLKLDDAARSRLGAANNSLGVNTVAGSRVWDSQSKFRLQFGPLSLKEFTALLPAGPAFQPAAGIARLMAGMEFDFDAQLILKAEEVPACRLAAGAQPAPRLGWTTWLKTRDFVEDDSQVILNVT